METVNNQYLGGDASLACSADTQKEIDRMVVELVKKEHEKAKDILTAVSYTHLILIGRGHNQDGDR